jgi:LPXTG-motif cell wall-anchored protein
MSEPDDPADRAELEAEVARLKARNESLEQQKAAAGSHRVQHVLRSIAAVVVLVLGVLCLVLAPPAIWSRNLVLDTDRYVDTLAPLANDPGVQSVVITQVSNKVISQIDISELVGEVLPQRASQLLGGPLESAFEGLVKSVTTKFVESDAFSKLWVGVNRVAHKQLVYSLTGEVPKNAATTVDKSGRVVLNLAPIVEQVKDRLVKAGLTVAKNIPPVGVTIEIANVHGLQQARRATHWLDVVADWLPWVGLALLAGGIALARKRRRTLIISTLCVAGGMLLIGVGITIGRSIYLANVPTDVIPRNTAGYLFDTLVRYLRWGIRLVLLLMLIVAIGAWVSGRGRGATAFRGAVARGPRALGSKLDSGPVGPFVVRYATALRVSVIALMVFILTLVDRPSLGAIILLAVILVILLLIIEMLRATAVRADTDAAPPPTTA